ncbi:hypothetical protein D3C81_1512200 [compost metagenome]
MYAYTSFPEALNSGPINNKMVTIVNGKHDHKIHGLDFPHLVFVLSINIPKMGLSSISTSLATNSSVPTAAAPIPYTSVK